MGVDCSYKATFSTSKPQNQGRRTKEEEMEARTLPLDIWRMRESRVLMYVFWRERERERELLYKIALGPQLLLLLFYLGFKGFLYFSL